MRKRTRKLTAIDLFSGCGGLSVGLKAAGFEVLAAVENEPLASSTYRLNHRDTLLLERDIKRIRPSTLMKRLNLEQGELSLLAGCPPCQGFSTLRTLNGGKSVHEPMNDLIFQFTKFVKVFMPRAIMMENVPRLISDARIDRFQDVICGLGYSSDARVLDAADYGTPQRRKRMVLIATREDEPVFADPARYRKSVRWAFSQLDEKKLADDPMHTYKVKYADHVAKIIERIPADGGSRSALPRGAQLKCHRKCDGFKDVYGRMKWSEPSPTITGGCINPSKGRFLHPVEDRAITLREASMLQGFPSGYQFDMSRGRYPVAQLIGNAFPPQFAASHAKALRAEWEQ